MSRTKRGEKGPGYDYWSRRHPGNGIDGYGKPIKKLTHKYERQLSKRELKAIEEGLKQAKNGEFAEPPDTEADYKDFNYE